jgi:hypothetical protein
MSSWLVTGWSVIIREEYQLASARKEPFRANPSQTPIRPRRDQPDFGIRWAKQA